MSENTLNIPAEHATVKSLVTLIRDEVSVANRQGRYAAYVAEFTVTKETVKDHAAALAALVYPADKQVQKKDGKRTRYGNAVQAAGNGLRRALETDPETKPATLRVSLSGEGGGTTVVPADHPLYDALIALINAEQG